MSDRRHRRLAALVDAHFAGQLSAADERRMRTHLDACAGCRDRYERHLLLAEIDPAVPDARTRIGAGLGLGSRRLWPGRSAPAFLALGGAAAVLAVLARSPAPAPFAARGGPERDREEIAVYAVAEGGEARRLEEGAEVRPDEELAFAFVNPSGRARLLVLGIDEHDHVFWYHPAWTRAGENPPGTPVPRAELLTELPEAVAQHLDGERLRLFALFTDRAITVRDVETSLPPRGVDRTFLPLEGVLQESLLLRVRQR